MYDSNQGGEDLVGDILGDFEWTPFESQITSRNNKVALK